MIEAPKQATPASLSELFALFEAQRWVRMVAAASGLTPLRLARMVASDELSGTKRANRRHGRGRRSYVDWARRFGMEPLDALVAFDILSRLGEHVRPATRHKLIADHARARDAAFGTLTFGPRRSEHDNFREVDLERLVKSFFDEVPPAYEPALAIRLADLPQDREGLRAELECISSRVVWSVDS